MNKYVEDTIGEDLNQPLTKSSKPITPTIWTTKNTEDDGEEIKPTNVYTINTMN